MFLSRHLRDCKSHFHPSGMKKRVPEAQNCSAQGSHLGRVLGLGRPGGSRAEQELSLLEGWGVHGPVVPLYPSHSTLPAADGVSVAAAPLELHGPLVLAWALP